MQISPRPLPPPRFISMLMRAVFPSLPRVCAGEDDMKSSANQWIALFISMFLFLFVVVAAAAAAAAVVVVVVVG